MVRIYEVYCGERFVGQYQGTSEEDAIMNATRKRREDGRKNLKSAMFHLYKAVAV